MCGNNDINKDYKRFVNWINGTNYFTNSHNRCMICGVDLFRQGVGLCEHCLHFVTFNNGKTCIRCGCPISGEQSFCGHCNAEKIYYLRAYSAFVYKDGIQRIVHQIKFGNKGAMCQQLAYYLAYLISKHNIDYDIVCCVPMTARAEKVRGYNQARLLSMALCQIVDKHCFVDALIKTKDTVSQEQLSRKQRLTNVDNAYAVVDKALVKDKRVLLIDDVKTTGATLNQCSKALIKAGASSVVCLTVASGEYKVSMEVDNDG